MAPGTFCALGAVLSDIRRDYVRTARHVIAGPADDDWGAIAAGFADLAREARAWIAAEGDLVGTHRLALSLNLRYPSQADEIEILLPEGADPSPGLVRALFHAEHERLYGFAEPESPVQSSTLRLAVIGRMSAATLPEAPPATPAPRGTRPLYHRGAWIAATVHERADLGPGAEVVGPALVDQPDSTILILPGWRARADRLGSLHLTRETA